MRHLVNLISNFPSDVNSSRTFTSLQECHDLDISATEMCKDIFDSPNLQVSVHILPNHSKGYLYCPIIVKVTYIVQSKSRLLILSNHSQGYLYCPIIKRLVIFVDVCV